MSIKFKDFVETVLDPLGSDYMGEKFELFLREARSNSCPGCGEVALAEYNVLDPERGIMSCPKCNQRTNLKTMMRAWLDVRVQTAGEA